MQELINAFQNVANKRKADYGDIRIIDSRTEGLTVLPVPQAAAAGDVVMLMLPDQVMGEVYRAEVAPALKPAAALGFAHGFAVAFAELQNGEWQTNFVVEVARILESAVFLLQNGGD